MKLIIAGSRTIDPSEAYDLIESALCNPGFEISEIVSGGAQGVDQTGERWAKAYGFTVKVIAPDWKTHGKKAGVLRNIEMGKYADRLLAIWDGESRGTAQMIAWMRMAGKPVQVLYPGGSSSFGWRISTLPQTAAVDDIFGGRRV